MDNSVQNIAERLFLKLSNTDDKKKFLIELRFCFQNLIGQEYRIDNLYENTIEIIK